jgi:methionyl-tRNA formyltransferase
MRYAFAGDRDISVQILDFLINSGFKPEALFVSEEPTATHKDLLIKKANLENRLVFVGNEFKNNLDLLNSLNLDYIIGIHFPYIIPIDVLNIPNVGVINLHPSYLPYNKGWHTASWAILDNSKLGATLHFMEETLDTGDIIHQIELMPKLNDTADSLYKKVLELEYIVFKEAFNEIVSLKPKRVKQLEIGTSHSKKDLAKIQEIELYKKYSGLEILNRLRALTTSNINEASFFINENGEKVYITLNLVKD